MFWPFFFFFSIVSKSSVQNVITGTHHEDEMPSVVISFFHVKHGKCNFMFFDKFNMSN